MLECGKMINQVVESGKMVYKTGGWVRKNGT